MPAAAVILFDFCVVFSVIFVSCFRFVFCGEDEFQLVVSIGEEQVTLNLMTRIRDPVKLSYCWGWLFSLLKCFGGCFTESGEPIF